ncbi:bifunctional phosphopantothenoylcysteine decarboxylase/phosphopantothenate--cysteine ligase CoaBC [Bacteriovorax sp. DB6_IX]|uniref:bifunctional phosphopantothenoylcysteine decarboxylase/phosphopantothenate--cysteine ligase CoaBC n=1 Tax=Bacteriovorax sp. DB6_IX TaxID=1353530 RepID=UPI000389FAC5|nr:bifunctional phosphopantothenoylcysteine decarboxylase/phosphopantothenate--cysteine ligase CoaBC [Bacteriovorax sp. DB6_IX]EQC52380.1 phosphopantothenoylcysteine decarboxylase/phosphopantothenate--cysteine ligase [Bacteriovorax sp. DB6_IX]
MKIILGVCGSIAAYKSIDLARGLSKKGHEVKVILTKGALEFLKPEVFGYLGIDYFLSLDDFENRNVLHIDLAKWCDHLLIYPTSANTLANLAFGKADDLLTSVFLAKRDETTTSIFPAMNTYMYRHPLTQENMDLLQRIHKAGNLFIHPPAAGKLACGDQGEGKAPSIDKVINCIEAINPKITNESKRVLITTGATIAPIDPVRFVTNSSSGKTGYELAVESLKRGYQTHVIAGKHATSQLDDLLELPGFTLTRVTTTTDMKTAVEKAFSQSDIYISSAAISDLEFEAHLGKMKKTQMSQSLEYKQAPDILKYVLGLKKDQQVVGFAAETDLSHDILNEKWTRKPVDLLVGTQVHSGLCHDKEQQGFNTDQAHYKFFSDGAITLDTVMLKSKLPAEIFNRLN